MGKFFILIYNFFERYKPLLYISLIGIVAVMSFFALRIRFEENIIRIFPQTGSSENMMRVFDNLRVKDKIIVMFSTKDDVEFNSVLEGCATKFKEDIEQRVGETHIKDILFRVDNQVQQQMVDLVYNQLPILLSDEDYLRIDSSLTQKRIAEIMHRNYVNLISPTGVVMKDYILKDPLGIAGNALQTLQSFQLEASYELNNSYIFSKDGKILLMFITPVFDMGNTAENDRLITAIENTIAEVEKADTNIDVEYFGGPSVSVYNARQIKKDTIITLSIALLIIIVFIFLVFKQRRTIPLIITPVIFGGLFALFIISLTKGTISSIAIGSGSIILGIALSYSIHFIAHQNHVSSIRELINELAHPLTIGSFTTICAFLGLLFTSSELLQDFGLFAAMTLIGTTIFCLIFLPHFLKPAKEEKATKVLRLIERFNSYPFEKNKWLIGGIILLLIVSLFTYKKVGFESNMNSMSFEPEHIKASEEKLKDIFENNKKTIYFVSTGKDINEASEVYHRTNKQLSEMTQGSLISGFASADKFIVSDKIRQERIEKWNAFWTPEKKTFVRKSIEDEVVKLRMKSTAFQGFFDWLDTDFSQVSQNDYLENSYLSEFVNESNDFCMLVSQVQFEEENKEIVYEQFEGNKEVVVFDQGYFVSEWVSGVKDDFYLVLFISSFLIFFSLLISFGRIELTLISFLPMFLSWIIIIGVMGIFGIQFNIVTIILSTFVFGIGDDFSIFIMDGLQNKYKTGKAILNSHKTAIFFSSFTIIIGMGALVFAKHPALQSVSGMSLLGMIVVVLISYTIQPIIFRWFISGPAARGNSPYSLLAMITTSIAYLIFLMGSLFIKLVILFLYLVPISHRKKKKVVNYLLMSTCRLLYNLMRLAKLRKDIPDSFFNKPSIIIANHQSFLDIITLLSLSTKVVMVTNQWVWKSPVFGSILRYVGFIYTGNGIDANLYHIEERIKEGYSVIIFPEGTRSVDGTINRFHRGAFYAAQKLNLEISPMLLYGTGNTIPKKQPFYLKRGIVGVKALERIKPNDTRFGENYREQSKGVRAYFREEYEKYRKEYDNSSNTYFYQRLVQNYIYKGPVIEWYVRIKVLLERKYDFFDKIIPETAKVTDIGCGYGLMIYMLNMYANKRKFLGIDYDKDKIEVAQHGFLKNENVQFMHGDVISCDLPRSDVFVLNDVLHYMDYEKQEALLSRCKSLLNPSGMLIVRDGNREEVQKQKRTKFTEILSTRVFKFNKINQELSFISYQQMKDFANNHNLRMESVKNDKITSNTIYIFRQS